MTSTRPLPAIVFYDNNTEIQCPYTFCGRPLEVKTCVNGTNRGRDYVCCKSKLHSVFWRYAVKRSAQPQRLAIASSTRETAPASHSVSRRCEEVNCSSTKVNKCCSKRKCKAHCLSSGGCDVAGHRPAPYSRPLPPPAPSFLDGLNLLAYASQPLPPAPYIDPREAHYRREFPHWFQEPSPSPPRAVLGTQPSPLLVTVVDFAKDREPGTVFVFEQTSRKWIRPGSQPYECYSTEFARWMQVKPGYPHQLHPHCRLLIKARGVVGSDEEHHIAMLAAEERNRDSDNDLPFRASTSAAAAATAATATRASTSSLAASSSFSTVPSLAASTSFGSSRAASSSTPCTPSLPARSKAITIEEDSDSDVEVVSEVIAIKKEPKTPPRRTATYSPSSSSPFPTPLEMLPWRF
ncbi:hypothetical protein R3P38DRAFT_2524733 [Favolaschia claudopus]|uniref:Uncharacterized protein n=1 Tax=Favolaschia claudopus TaxID=2862362 RepID=A0AAW0BR88_9AGAR